MHKSNNRATNHTSSLTNSILSHKNSSKATGNKDISNRDSSHVWYKDKFLIVLLISIANLGDRPFWGDEIHLINLGESITAHGLPIVDDRIKNVESTYEIDDTNNQGYHPSGVSYDIIVNGKEVYTLHPWATSYVMALMMLIFGYFSEFFIRLPFVLFGIAAIPVTYTLAMRLTNKRFTSIVASILLGLSVVFLLAIRCADYYGIIIFCVPLIILSYIDVLSNMRYAPWMFCLSSVLLFHAQWVVFFSIMLSVALHFLIYERKWKSLKKFIFSIIIIFLFTFPWFYLTRQFDKSTVVPTASQYLSLVSIGIYHYITWFVPLIFIIGLFIFFIVKYFYNKSFVRGFKKIYIDSHKYSLLIIPAICSLIVLSFNYYTGTPIRYFYGLLSLAMIINACVIEMFWKKSKVFGVCIIALMLFTNIIFIAPLIPLKAIFTNVAGSENVLGTGTDNQQAFFVKSLTIRTELCSYFYEITHHVQSSTREIINTIQKYGIDWNGKNIFVAAGDSNSIGYYIGLKPRTNPNNFLTRDYDLITMPVNDPRNKAINLKTYDKVEVKLSIDQWGDTADPVHHLFKTTSGEGFYIYKKNTQPSNLTK